MPGFAQRAIFAFGLKSYSKIGRNTLNSDAFSMAFTLTVGEEGGFTNDRADPGNWTGGAVGKGVCNGTNWGISAASYPTLNIRQLTQADAQAIYRRDYWAAIRGDDLPSVLAQLAFDAAVNNGPDRARVWLQGALAVATDGVLGTETMQALARLTTTPDGVRALACEFQARRIDFMACLTTWQRFGLGWSRRLCRVLVDATAN